MSDPIEDRVDQALKAAAKAASYETRWRRFGIDLATVVVSRVVDDAVKERVMAHAGGVVSVLASSPY